MRLKDKVAIITGAASGMGASTAKIFADQGAKVIVADVAVDDGAAVAAEIVAAGGEARFLKLDVSSEADWASAVSETVSAYGQIDILVNSAGISGSTTDLMNTHTWDVQMDVVAKGVFLGMQAVIPVMQKAERGAIVNVSSISGMVGQPHVHMGYNAAKGAIRVATKSAAVQFAADGIRVNSVHPGIMPPMKNSTQVANPEGRRLRIAAVPAQREGRVEEVAYANLFLASDEASFITGVELPVDGGLLAQ
ncbi:MAG: NAD(P)-dependent dehydrogenase (short-subunit alcohol dehydrogenase family) [Acidimicrobiales bacterium]|jgi:NAD(P)-dependent dehydrogenase (short-subunit alcohol dehydrogenase family)